MRLGVESRRYASCPNSRTCLVGRPRSFGRLSSGIDEWITFLLYCRTTLRPHAGMGRLLDGLVCMEIHSRGRTLQPRSLASQRMVPRLLGMANFPHHRRAPPGRSRPLIDDGPLSIASRAQAPPVLSKGCRLDGPKAPPWCKGEFTYNYVMIRSVHAGRPLHAFQFCSTTF